VLALDLKYFTTIALEPFWTVLCYEPISGDLFTFSGHYSIFAGLAFLTSILLDKDVRFISCRERECLETTADLIEGLYLPE